MHVGTVTRCYYPIGSANVTVVAARRQPDDVAVLNKPAWVAYLWQVLFMVASVLSLVILAAVPLSPNVAATPKPRSTINKPARRPPPPNAGCSSSVVQLAIKWHERQAARRNQRYKPGRTGLTANSFELSKRSADLDGDGKPDVILKRKGGGLRSAMHYFYVTKKRCHVLVGVISLSPLFGFYCERKRARGLCILHTSRLMIHGETERSTYVFNGKRYALSGRPTLGPRPRKFRPKRKP